VGAFYVGKDKRCFGKCEENVKKNGGDFFWGGCRGLFWSLLRDRTLMTQIEQIDADFFVVT
jgi:hypothetical protein